MCDSTNPTLTIKVALYFYWRSTVGALSKLAFWKYFLFKWEIFPPWKDIQTHVLWKTWFTSTRSFIFAIQAEINTNLEGLLSKLQDPGQRQNYEWIRRRIRMLWPRWMSAITQLQSKHDGFSNRVQKRVGYISPLLPGTFQSSLACLRKELHVLVILFLMMR